VLTNLHARRCVPFNAALEALRAARRAQAFIHAEPLRNPSGVVSEVRAYDRDGGRLLAEVTIRANGELARVRVRQN
jgi:hypothetical protein